MKVTNENCNIGKIINIKKFDYYKLVGRKLFAQNRNEDERVVATVPEGMEGSLKAKEWYERGQPL